MTRSCGFLTGSGRSASPLATEKIAVVAPMPSASVRSAALVTAWSRPCIERNGEPQVADQSAQHVASPFSERSASSLPASDFFIICEYMQRQLLTDFELMILLAILRAGEDAYGVRIADEIEQHRHAGAS